MIVKFMLNDCLACNIQETGLSYGRKTKTMTKTHNPMITIKLVYFFTMLFGLNFVNPSVAGIPGSIYDPRADAGTARIAPVTPREATFTDVAPVAGPVVSVSQFAPSTPAVADFEDAAIAPVIIISEIAPSVPAEASFEETGMHRTDNPLMLAPVTPVAADFSDTI